MCIRDSYEVCATDGQICDLPTEEMGIDPDTFVPKFRLTDRGRDALKRIRPLIPEAKTVYLATETSAAGESLAAQLASRLRLKHYRRIHLTSLTLSLIHIYRSQIEAYCKKHGLTPPNDAQFHQLAKSKQANPNGCELCDGRCV